jgi:hypothetical protein
MTLSLGLYDLVLTEAVARSLDAIAPDVPDLRDFDSAEVADRLVEVLGRQLRIILDNLSGDIDKAQAHAQLDFINGLLVHLRGDNRVVDELVDPIKFPPRVLHTIRGPGV